MRAFKGRIRTILSYAITVILIGSYPISISAQAVPTDSTVTAPTGPTSPPAPTYTFDPATGRWNTDSWRYNAASGQYVKVVAPPPAAPPTSSVIGPTTPPAGSATNPTLPSTATTATTSQGPQSVGSTTNSTSLASNANSSTNNTIGNGLNSTAQTGNTAVSANTAAGNATSGGANANGTLMNTINSTVTGAAGGVATFVSNIAGNVNGDIMLYPMMIGAMLSQAATNQATTTQSIKSTVNANTVNQINNSVNLAAKSGTAAVTGNTAAGNATSGSANAVADVMNIINSIVAANKSFVGTINIYGNLNGDILVAPDFIPQLLANNAPGSTNQSSSTTNNALNVSLHDTSGITNNVNLAAASGAATVSGNTKAGSATSGTAGTNLVILNLTGHKIVASNSLLVFVNVLGKWVGMIVDAPTGATAAALGSGVVQDTTLNQAATVAAQTNNQITNNINLSAQSGAAAVTGNTKAGNASSGNATASANILNMAQSSLGLSGWFGVLFINVFGSWIGSFGIDTSAGNPPTVAGVVDPTSPLTPKAVQFIAKPSPAAGSRQRLNLLPIGNSQSTGSLPPTTIASIPNATDASIAKAKPVSSNSRATSTQNGAYISATTVLGAVLVLGATIRTLWPMIYRRLSTFAS